jgi:SSS family solute:Na+ symporter
MIPGFFLSLLAVIIVSLLTKKPSNDVQNQFIEMKEILIKESK